MPTTATHFKPSPPRRQAGLSLVELMISLTIGMILLVGITTLIVQQSSTRDELEKSSRQIENGRYAMQILHNDIEHAGFYGVYALETASSVVPTDPCSNSNTGWNAPATTTVPAAIYGYSGAPSDPTLGTTTCGLTNYKPNTSVLVVRRTTSNTVAPAAAVAGTTYLQVSQCGGSSTLFAFASAPTGVFTMSQKDCVTPAPLFPYVVNVYYISTCDLCGTDTIPTLKMVQVGPTQAPVITPLVEGIENMQLDYGLDNDGDGYPDIYTQTPGPTDWLNVMAIRVNLLARNTECTTGYTDTKTYTLGLAAPASAPASTCTNGDYKRHEFSELIRAINPSGRRALQ